MLSNIRIQMVVVELQRHGNLLQESGVSTENRAARLVYHDSRLASSILKTG
jgi:hypothetical protein